LAAYAARQGFDISKIGTKKHTLWIGERPLAFPINFQFSWSFAIMDE